MQKLQGKANFLRRFIPNYAEMAKGFTQLLKKGFPSIATKLHKLLLMLLSNTLVQASLMYPPNYQNDYFLYIVTTETTIAMVLVQVENGIEHPIYYFIHNLNDTKVNYSYVEKLALAAVQDVQSFRHYILLQKTTIVSDCNPMTCIITLIAGEKIFKMNRHFAGI